MKYKTGDLIRNTDDNRVRMIEGVAWGYGDWRQEGYVVNVSFGYCETWNDNNSELVMTKEELKTKLKMKRDIYSNDNSIRGFWTLIRKLEKSNA